MLVTGASSFLGHHLIPKLQQNSKIFNSEFNYYTQWKILTPTSKELDLTSLPSVLKYFDENEFDTIIHLAAKVGGIGLNKNKPADLTLDNLLMGMNLYSGIKLHLDKIKNVYNISTTCGYPKNCPVPFKEEDLWNGREEETNNGYSYAKKALIVLGEKFRIQYGLNSVCLMVANLLGEHDHFDLENSHVVPALIRKMVDIKEDQMQYKMCGIAVPMWGDGSATRDFLYAGDCAEAICKAVYKNINYDKPINIGTGKEISIKELGEQLIDIIGVRGHLSFDKGSNPLNGQPRRCLEVSKAKEILGFEATTSLRESLIKTVRWFEEQRKIEKEKKPMLYIETPSMWIKLPKEDMYYKDANDKKIINNRKLLPYEFDSMFNGWQNLYFYCNRNDVSTVTNVCVKHPVKIDVNKETEHTIATLYNSLGVDFSKDLEECKDKITVGDLYRSLGLDCPKYKDKLSIKDLESIKYKLALDSLIKEFDKLNAKKTDNNYIKPKKNTKKPNDVKFDFKAALKRAGMSDAQLEETGVIKKYIPYEYRQENKDKNIDWMVDHPSLKCENLTQEEHDSLSKNFDSGARLKELEILNKLEEFKRSEDCNLLQDNCLKIKENKNIDELIEIIQKKNRIKKLADDYNLNLSDTLNQKEINSINDLGFLKRAGLSEEEIVLLSKKINSRKKELEDMSLSKNNYPKTDGYSALISTSTHEINKYKEIFGKINSIDELNKSKEHYKNETTKVFCDVLLLNKNNKEVFKNLNECYSREWNGINVAFNSRLKDLELVNSLNDMASILDGYDLKTDKVKSNINPYLFHIDGYETFPIKIKDNKLPIEKTVTEVKVKRDEEETARIKTKLNWHKAQQAATDKYNEIFGKIYSIDELKKIKEYYITANSFYATPNNELPENVQFRLIQETCGVNDAFSSRLKVLEKAETLKAEKPKEMQNPVIENNVEIIPRVEKPVTEVKVKRDEEETAKIKTKLIYAKLRQAATDKYNEIFSKINSIEELKKSKEYYITTNPIYSFPKNELHEDAQNIFVQDACGVNDAFSFRLKVLEKLEDYNSKLKVLDLADEKLKEIQNPVIENNVEIIPPSLPYKISRFVSSIKHAVKDLID